MKRPTMPPMNATGEHCHEGQGSRDGQADLRVPRWPPGRRRVSSPHEPVDVLQDDDGVVNDDPTQRQGEQGQDVQGESHGVHEANVLTMDAGMAMARSGWTPVAKEQQDDEAPGSRP